MGWQIALHYEDRGISGTVSSRPGYQAMLAAADKKEFDCLIVDDTSRLTRNNAEMQKLVNRLKRRAIRLVTASDGIDSEAKGYKMFAGMHGIINEAFIDSVREKTHRGLSGKVLQGHSAGGRCYGYKSIPFEHPTKKDAHGRPEIEYVRREIDPEQVKWVLWVFEQYSRGQSPRAIAAELNRLGVPSSRGGTWCASAIHGEASKGTGMINNPLYNGRYVWNRSMWMRDYETDKRTYIARPESEWLVTEMPELRIIPPELWEAVQRRQADTYGRTQAIRKALKNPKTKTMPGRYLFSGLLKCGCCGASYVMQSTTSYGCSYNINRGDAACNNRLRIPRLLVEEVLLENIYGNLYTEDAINLYVKELEAALKQKAHNPHPDLEANRKALVKTQTTIDNVMAAIKAGIITATTKAELMQAEAEKVRLEGSVLSNKQKTVQIMDFLPHAPERYKKLIENLSTTLQGKVAEAQECLKTLIGSVKLYPDASGQYLEAEVQHNMDGLLAVALGEKFKVDLVAGARNPLVLLYKAHDVTSRLTR